MMKIDDLHNDLAMWHFSISAFQRLERAIERFFVSFVLKTICSACIIPFCSKAQEVHLGGRRRFD